MLFDEGVAYAVLTIIFSITAGSLISRLAIQAIAGELWFFEWNFSITPTLIVMPVLIGLCVAIPLVCYKFMQKESLVERLRVE
jgi:putative ABC transport system permease protein